MSSPAAIDSKAKRCFMMNAKWASAKVFKESFEFISGAREWNPCKQFGKIIVSHLSTIVTSAKSSVA
jgi:hypothetical protein